MKHKMIIEITRDELEWLLSGYPNEEDAEKLWMMLKDATPLEKVLGEIKEEIEAKAKEREFYLDSGHPYNGLYEALDIIDSHISGKESD